jgi:hypothetical protein
VPTPEIAKFPLDGATASGDIDLENQAAHFTGTLPGLPNFAGEVLVVAGKAYTRAPGAAKYTAGPDTDVPWNLFDASNGPFAIVQLLVKVSASKDLSPKLLGTEQCDGGPCYHIQVQATPAVVKAEMVLMGFSITGTGPGSAIVDLWVLQDSYEVAILEIHTVDPYIGAAAIQLAMNQWDGITPIVAPDPDQYGGASTATPVASY